MQSRAKCFKCPAIAVWYYDPGKGSPSDYYCDNCVARGCSCTLLEDGITYELDNLGRKIPCCEYMYCERGFDDEDYEED